MLELFSSAGGGGSGGGGDDGDGDGDSGGGGKCFFRGSSDTQTSSIIMVSIATQTGFSKAMATIGFKIAAMLVNKRKT